LYFLITIGLNYDCQLQIAGRFLMSHGIGSRMLTVVSTCLWPRVCDRVFV